MYPGACPGPPPGQSLKHPTERLPQDGITPLPGRLPGVPRPLCRAVSAGPMRVRGIRGGFDGKAYFPFPALALDGPAWRQIGQFGMNRTLPSGGGAPPWNALDAVYGHFWQEAPILRNAHGTENALRPRNRCQGIPSLDSDTVLASGRHDASLLLPGRRNRNEGGEDLPDLFWRSEGCTMRAFPSPSIHRQLQASWAPGPSSMSLGAGTISPLGLPAPSAPCCREGCRPP